MTAMANSITKMPKNIAVQKVKSLTWNRLIVRS
jgi:hypothetical protein